MSQINELKEKNKDLQEILQLKDEAHQQLESEKLEIEQEGAELY